MSPLLTVRDAHARVIAAFDRLPAEMVSVADAAGRVLAQSPQARLTQPPADLSAMDGYAVRAEDVPAAATTLKLVGQAPAGGSYDHALKPGEAVRIFTGAPVPAGADLVIIQEEAVRDGETVRFEAGADPKSNIRAAGGDFKAGDGLLPPGVVVDPWRLCLVASAGLAEVPVARRPRVAILATGDELVAPGEPVGRDQIVASNSFSLAALVEKAGGAVLDLGIASDDHADLAAKIAQARSADADVLITLGGASVGAHDLVQAALTRAGMALGFWKIAMRPGKPMMTGRLGRMVVVGLPGNPVSSIVCGHLFVLPLIEALLGMADADRDRSIPALLGRDMPGNDEREDYLRSELVLTPDGWVAMPFDRQDSSMLGTLARAQALTIRPAHAAPARKGDACRILPLR